MSIHVSNPLVVKLVKVQAAVSDQHERRFIVSLILDDESEVTAVAERCTIDTSVELEPRGGSRLTICNGACTHE